jgi:hypothetical protein
LRFINLTDHECAGAICQPRDQFVERSGVMFLAFAFAPDQTRSSGPDYGNDPILCKKWVGSRHQRVNANQLDVPSDRETLGYPKSHT